MPRDRHTPPPFESAELDRSLNRYLTAGLVFMAVLISGFITYAIREPDLRATAKTEQDQTYRSLGKDLFDKNCSSCHGTGANGASAPVLNAKEFLKVTSDNQMHILVAAGISGSDMPAWSLDFGGTLTDEQVRQVTTYLRSLEAAAPSVPAWRKGKPKS